jgi:hypothetical protein
MLAQEQRRDTETAIPPLPSSGEVIGAARRVDVIDLKVRSLGPTISKAVRSSLGPADQAGVPVGCHPPRG